MEDRGSTGNMDNGSEAGLEGGKVKEGKARASRLSSVKFKNEGKSIRQHTGLT